MLNKTDIRFSNLPNEILDRGLSDIPTSDLTKLCLVSKSLRRAAEPFLYSDVTFRWSDGITPPIVPLLRTLFERPELVALIDTVTLQESLLSNSRRPRLNTTQTPVHQFLEAIDQSQVPYRTDWILGLYTGQMNAIAVLLISNLARTTRLVIDHNIISGHDFVVQVLRSNIFDQLPGFKRLERIRYAKNLDHPLSERNEMFKNVLSLFYVPTVMHIVATNSNPKIFRWPRAEPNSDYLVSLDIRWPIEQFLAKILTRTRNLKSLSWKWIYCDNINADPETTFLNFSRIKKTVLPVRVNQIMEFRELRVTISGSFNGFRDFVELTPLKYLPLVSLAGVGTELPDGLEAFNLLRASINDEETTRLDPRGSKRAQLE
ncbi:unnamed protein product [Clonostachys rosea f. rosea IK726]|uniref:Uncharacterized protein n=1 Tax=Clonostachys rosea f. rosea IK726 TaxID=1349383 RepID=A0ACA9U5K1_BIOOC|nr:unnamed protein product [Clonostachys rosea f. rosea IK726]